MDTKKERQIIKRLFASLLPIEAVAVGLPAVNDLLNSFIIGAAEGPLVTAAIGFAGPFTLFIGAISNMLSGGSLLVCGRNLGAGRRDEIKTVYTTTLVIGVLCGILITVITQLFPGAIAVILGTGSESMKMTSDYVRGIGLGAAFTVPLASLIPFLQINNMRKICNITVLIQLAVNLVGTILCVLIFGDNVLLVGMATSAANAAAAIFAFIYLERKSELFSFSLKAFNIKAIKPVFHSGLPNAIEPVCTLIRDTIINSVFYSLGGPLAVSAKSIACNLSTALGSFLYGGYTGACRMVCCVLVGERDSSSLRDLPKVMIQSGWYLYVIAYALVFAFANPIARLFVSEPDQVALYVWVIRLYNLWFFTSIFKSPPIAIYQAMDRIKEVLLFTVLNYLVFAIPFVLLVGKHLGLPYVAVFGTAVEIMVILSMAVVFTIKAKRLPRSITELCYIPSTISAPRQDRFKAVVSTREDACRASEGLIAFCRDRGVPSKKAYFCGLSLEEILVFTITNRFRGKNHTIDVRVIHENGSVSMLIRDDCEEFDPVKWLKLCNPEDEEKSIGIRMVRSFSETMDYMSTLGLNVLKIKL